MSRHDVRPCPCGSGKDSTWACDARGIELCRTCASCHKRQMKRYRPDVLTDSNYWADEPIEADY
jgi:7-cyano-7-deazaguanine synthase in queuosine biosynthesis